MQTQDTPRPIGRKRDNHAAFVPLTAEHVDATEAAMEQHRRMPRAHMATRTADGLDPAEHVEEIRRQLVLGFPSKGDTYDYTAGWEYVDRGGGKAEPCTLATETIAAIEQDERARAARAWDRMTPEARAHAQRMSTAVDELEDHLDGRRMTLWMLEAWCEGRDFQPEELRDWMLNSEFMPIVDGIDDVYGGELVETSWRDAVSQLAGRRVSKRYAHACRILLRRWAASSREREVRQPPKKDAKGRWRKQKSRMVRTKAQDFTTMQLKRDIDAAGGKPTSQRWVEGFLVDIQKDGLFRLESVRRGKALGHCRSEYFYVFAPVVIHPAMAGINEEPSKVQLEDLHAMFVEMYEAGAPLKDIAAATGRSMETVKRWRKLIPAGRRRERGRPRKRGHEALVAAPKKGSSAAAVAVEAGPEKGSSGPQDCGTYLLHSESSQPTPSRGSKSETVVSKRRGAAEVDYPVTPSETVRHLALGAGGLGGDELVGAAAALEDRACRSDLATLGCEHVSPSDIEKMHVDEFAEFAELVRGIESFDNDALNRIREHRNRHESSCRTARST